MEAVYYFVRVFVVNEVIVMVIFFHLRLENVVDEVERIDRLQLAERLSLFNLPHIDFRRVEKLSWSWLRFFVVFMNSRLMIFLLVEVTNT